MHRQVCRLYPFRCGAAGSVVIFVLVQNHPEYVQYAKQKRKGLRNSSTANEIVLSQSFAVEGVIRQLKIKGEKHG
jgi:hypothetical protein